MKKLLMIPILAMFLVLLVSCTSLSEYIDSVRPVAHAPALTENEAAFVEMIPTLQKAGIAITNNTTFGTSFEKRNGSGVIIKQVEGNLYTTYYAITTQWVVENALTVTVLTADKETVTATIL